MGAAALAVGKRSQTRLGGAMRVGSIAIALLTSGCMATIEGGPARLYTVDQEVVIAQGLVERLTAQYYDNGPATEALRNEIIARRMYIIDVQYSEYEASLTRDRQLFGFGTSTAGQALTIGSTLAASQSSARVLSGLAGGVGALRGIYDTELIIAKSLQILQGQMRAQRDVVGTRLEERMGWTLQAYPLSAALADLEDYYRAGTLNTGLINAARDSGENAIRAGEIRGNAIIVRTGVFAPNEPTLQALRAFLSGPQAATRRAEVDKCIAQERVSLTFRGLMGGLSGVPARQAVISCLRAKNQPI
jgi:hypothetical protein